MAPHSSTLSLENPMGGGAWWAAVHGVAESDTTEWLPFHFSFLCIGEGNGNPLQCSCLKNPRDGGAWWAAISGVTQSQTRLKWLSSSSSSMIFSHCSLQCCLSPNSFWLFKWNLCFKIQPVPTSFLRLALATQTSFLTTLLRVHIRHVLSWGALPFTVQQRW